MNAAASAELLKIANELEANWPSTRRIIDKLRSLATSLATSLASPAQVTNSCPICDARAAIAAYESHRASPNPAPVKAGMIGHVDHGKTTLTAALIALGKRGNTAAPSPESASAGLVEGLKALAKSWDCKTYYSDNAQMQLDRCRAELTALLARNGHAEIAP